MSEKPDIVDAEFEVVSGPLPSAALHSSKPTGPITEDEWRSAHWLAKLTYFVLMGLGIAGLVWLGGILRAILDRIWP